MKKIHHEEVWQLEEEIEKRTGKKFTKGLDYNINYYPDIAIKDNNEKSLFYIHKENYDLNNMDSLFKYLMDAEQAYNESDNYYIWDGKTLCHEYDEDMYISYHFNNIPEEFFYNDEFAIRFFLDNDDKTDEFCYGTNIFRCNNGVFFDVKNIDTVINIFNNIHYNYNDWFKVMYLNGTALIDILNEYNEEDYIDIRSIDQDWIDKDLINSYFEKYKKGKFKKKLENKLPEKGTKEKRSKI